MNKNDWTNTLSSRMSLRAPQRESLEILDCLTELLLLEKNADLKAALESVQSEYPQVADSNVIFRISVSFWPQESIKQDSWVRSLLICIL